VVLRWFDIRFFNELAQVYRMDVLNTGDPMGPYWMPGCSLLTSPVTIFPLGSG